MSVLAVAPDPTAVATSLVADAGGAAISAITGVLPVLVPFLATLWAIGFVVKKIPIFKKKGAGV